MLGNILYGRWVSKLSLYQDCEVDKTIQFRPILNVASDLFVLPCFFIRLLCRQVTQACLACLLLWRWTKGLWSTDRLPLPLWPASHICQLLHSWSNWSTVECSKTKSKLPQNVTLVYISQSYFWKNYSLLTSICFIEPRKLSSFLQISTNKNSILQTNMNSRGSFPYKSAKNTIMAPMEEQIWFDPRCLKFSTQNIFRCASIS